MREVLRTGSDRDVLAMKTYTRDQVKELTTPLRLETSEPRVKADIAFSVSNDITPECQKLGKLSQGQISQVGAMGDMILPISKNMAPEYVNCEQLPIERQKRQGGKFGQNIGIPVLGA